MDNRKQYIVSDRKPQFSVGDYISNNANVITDVLKGYLPLKKGYPNLEQIPSEKGKGMQQLHIHIK